MAAAVNVQGGVPAGPPKISEGEERVRKTRDDTTQRRDELRRQAAEADQAAQVRQAQQAKGVGQNLDTQA